MSSPLKVLPTSNPILTRLLKGDLAIVFYFAILKLLVHVALIVNGGYGFFRDELYYLACSDHLAIGYVDQPPLSIFILKIFTSIFGENLFGVRIAAALCGAATIFITGLMTIRMGGKTYAQILACICSFTWIAIGTNSVYSMNSIDILIWTLSAWLVMLIIEEQKKTIWIVLGIVLGLGLLNKISVLFLGAGIFAGFLATRNRQWLSTLWPYAGGAIAALLFTPYVIWNFLHDFAHLEFIHNASTGKYSGLDASKFLVDQLMMNNPLAFPVWFAGLLVLLLHRDFKSYRWLGFLYIVPLFILLFNGTSKAEYLAAGYGILWAAGSVWWEKITMKPVIAYTIRPLMILLIVSLAITFMPFAVAILPVEKYIAYAKALDQEPTSTESKQLAELPQHFADMFGWEQKAIDVAKVFGKLSDEEKKKCAIVGNNYGDCGAIDFFGEKLGLPKAIGTHNNYWIWGPRDYTGEIVIIMGGQYSDHVEDFQSIEEVAISDCQYCMPYEDNMRIFLCRGLKVNLNDVWPSQKHYD